MLARGPLQIGTTFGGYMVNGIRFHTQSSDKNLKTQNSGVMVNAQTESFSKSSDKNPLIGIVDYYGTIIEIFKLNYYEKFKVVLFKCQWVNANLNNAVEKENGLTLVNLSCLGHENDPFVLATQVKQVFYIPHPKRPNWNFVMKTTPRDMFAVDGLDVDMKVKIWLIVLMRMMSIQISTSMKPLT